MSVVYDTGALVAADRDDRRIWAEHRARLEVGIVPATAAPVVAQASRAPKQVQLGEDDERFLRGCEVVPFAADQVHRVGALLASAGTSEVVDAHVALVAAEGRRTIVTSEPDDMRLLSAYLGEPLSIHPI